MKFYATRGLPGSGKSTIARQMVLDAKGQLIRINRDDIREMAHVSKFSKDREKVTNSFRDAMIRAALSAGRDVIVDDTGFGSAMDQLRALAQEFDAEFNIIEVDTDLHTCIERDRERGINGGRSVGEKVIRNMWEHFVKNHEKQDEALPHCIIVDMDGTLALIHNGRSPYQDDLAYDDMVNEPVAKMVQGYLISHQRVKFIVMSGRDEGRSRAATERWLEEKFGYKPDALYMRTAGDTRHDNIIKRELYEKYVKDRFFVDFVVDDRDQVVRLWRDTLGLPCFQVGWGNF